MSDIKLTAGRVVHYHRRGRQQVPLAATIAFVNSYPFAGVNLTAHEASGAVTPVLEVPFRQPDDPDPPPNVSFAEWMPYQVKKNSGSESGEEAAGTQSI